MTRSRAATIPRIAGTVCLAFYCLWNLYWLAAGRIPPSIVRELLGVPSPTTGATRSWLAAFHGHFREALLWNPLALPIALLYAATIAFVLAAAVRRRSINLPPTIAWSWLILLPAAWVAKLIIGPAWW